MALVERGGGVERHVPRATRVTMPRAVMDVRLPWPLGRAVLVAGLLGTALFVVGTMALGSTQYHGELSLFVPKLNNPNPARGIEIVDRRVTALTAIARSQPFLVELQRESGVDVSVEDLQDMIEATRPNFGAIALITVTGTDPDVVERLNAHLATAMSEVVDRLRRGAILDTDSNGFNIAAGDDPDYTGPLYLELYRDPSGGEASVIGETGPRVVVNALIGFVLAVMATVFFGAITHERRQRATDREDLETLLDLDQLAGVPRPDRRRGDGSARAMLGFANELAAMAGELPVVAVGGAGTRRIRSRFARTLTRSLAAVSGRSVVLVDLGPTPFSRLRRSVGVLDLGADAEAAARAAAIDSMIRPISRWSVPRWARSVGHGVDVGQIGPGTASSSGDVAEDQLATVLGNLAERYAVVVNLPELPGKFPVGAALSAAVAGVVVVVDGWTVLDDARVVADALDAAVAGPVGYVLMEN